VELQGIAAAVMLAAALRPSVRQPPLQPTTADLEYSSSGSGPAAAEFNRVIPLRAVQAVLLDIARAPRDRAYVDAASRARTSPPNAFAAIGLIREAGPRIAWRSVADSRGPRGHPYRRRT